MKLQSNSNNEITHRWMIIYYRIKTQTKLLKMFSSIGFLLKLSAGAIECWLNVKLSKTVRKLYVKN